MGVSPLAPEDERRLGPYRLIGRLGAGGMGVVYLGVAPDGRAVAVKVVRPELAGDEVGRHRFLREIDALRRVRAPYVVQVLDADVVGDRPYLVTAYVPGDSLATTVADAGPASAERLARFAGALALALQGIHAAGVVHRDLTPRNVLVVDGDPVVIDFGIARALDASAVTATGLLVGTPGYLAPEQVLRGEASPASDVFAWGATVAFAGTGRPPFGTGPVDAVVSRILHGQPDLGGLPSSIAEVVREAMDRNPDARPTATDVAARLRPLASFGPRPDAGAAALAVDPVTTALPVDSATSVLPVARNVASPTLVATRAEPAPRLLSPARLPPPPRLGQPEEPLVPEASAGPLTRALGGLALLALLAGLAALAPVVATGLALMVLLGLRAAGRARSAHLERRARRGPRSGDGVLTTLALPWHLLGGLLDTVVTAPVAAIAAAIAAAPVYSALLGRLALLEAAAWGAAAGAVAWTAAGIWGPLGRRPRRIAASGLRHGTPMLVLGLTLAALAALWLARALPAAWWPLDASRVEALLG